MKHQHFISISLAFFFFIGITSLRLLCAYQVVSPHNLTAAAWKNGANSDSWARQSKIFLYKEYLPIYGSSELSTFFIPFHPTFIFSMERTGFEPFLIGAGGSQSLIHLMNISSVGENCKKKKIVFILSPQWFSQEGLSENYFRRWFSELKAYKTFKNPCLSSETKIKIAKRLLYFNKSYSFLLNQTLNSIVNNRDLVLSLLKPLAIANEYKLEIQDYLVSYKNQNKGIKPVAPINIPPQITPHFWTQAVATATKMGAQSCTNNDFGIYDSYYLKYVEPQLFKSKNININASISGSPEYEDFKLLLSILTELHIQALFVIVPVNGRWYDYTGFPLKERIENYKKCKEMIEKSGFVLADFSTHEYDKYFLADVMHMGWKGWCLVNEAIYEFYFNYNK